MQSQQQNYVREERERFISMFQELQGGLENDLSALNTIFESPCAEKIFSPEITLKPLADMKQDLTYLMQNAENPLVVKQEIYNIKINRLLHSVSIALLRRYS